MLLEFRVENYRSLLNEQVLTTEAAKKRSGSNDEDGRPRELANEDKCYLPVVVIYGANASGKSNVLSALEFMQYAVVSSHRLWEPDSGIPRTPFAWGDGRSNPSMFEITFVIESCKYVYGFVVNDTCVIEEWLHAFPNGRKQVWFTRDQGNDFTFGDNLLGENKVIEEITGPNSLFLSAATQNRHLQLFPIYSWFRSIDIATPSITKRRHPYFYRSTVKSILSKSPDEISEKENHLIDRFRLLLKNSDFGIVNLRIEPIDSETRNPNRTRVYLEHAVDDDDPWLPLHEESQGTQTMFQIAMPIIQALEGGKVLVIDELESSLHPLLAIEIVKLFNDPVSNPKNAQLIFTTHDSNLMGTTLGDPILRRDQVFLAEKNGSGESEIYPLTDYHPRKSENLERGYLQGRYGAIPFLGEISKSWE